MVALLFPLPASAHATRPIPVSGVFDYTFTIIYDRVIGDKILIFATEDELWQGSFSGTAEAVFIVIIFSSDLWKVWLRTTFTGTVDGKYGTMVIQLIGERTYWDEDTFWWSGHWRIIHGTGELRNIHGQGVWWGPGYEDTGGEIPDVPGDRPDIYYEGEIYFN